MNDSQADSNRRRERGSVANVTINIQCCGPTLRFQSLPSRTTVNPELLMPSTKTVRCLVLSVTNLI